MKTSSNLTGIAGAHYVSAILSQKGFIAMLTSRNTKGIDILVSSETSFKSVGIQIKANRDSRRKGWLLSKKDENIESENLIYCFVNLKVNEIPDVYIVPSELVAKTLREEYQIWLNTPGKNGQTRNDNSMRMFFAKDGQLNQWEIIENLLM